jgi:hypothetical protein
MFKVFDMRFKPVRRFSQIIIWTLIFYVVDREIGFPAFYWFKKKYSLCQGLLRKTIVPKRPDPTLHMHAFINVYT